MVGQTAPCPPCSPLLPNRVLLLDDLGVGGAVAAGWRGIRRRHRAARGRSRAGRGRRGGQGRRGGVGHREGRAARRRECGRAASLQALDPLGPPPTKNDANRSVASRPSPSSCVTSIAVGSPTWRAARIERTAPQGMERSLVAPKRGRVEANSNRCRVTVSRPCHRMRPTRAQRHSPCVSGVAADTDDGGDARSAGADARSAGAGSPAGGVAPPSGATGGQQAPPSAFSSSPCMVECGRVSVCARHARPHSAPPSLPLHPPLRPNARGRAQCRARAPGARAGRAPRSHRARAGARARAVSEGFSGRPGVARVRRAA